MTAPADAWYKRDPQAFLGGVQGMGPELIGAYAVILEILYARGGDMPRDDRHLSGVLGCSLRKARSLTEQLIAIGKIKIEGGKVVNDRATQVLETRRNQRETLVKPIRNGDETGGHVNENRHLTPTEEKREDNTPQPPFEGGRDRVSRFGVHPEALRKLGL